MIVVYASTTAIAVVIATVVVVAAVVVVAIAAVTAIISTTVPSSSSQEGGGGAMQGQVVFSLLVPQSSILDVLHLTDYLNIFLCVFAYLRSAWEQKPDKIRKYAEDAVLKKLFPHVLLRICLSYLTIR